MEESVTLSPVIFGVPRSLSEILGKKSKIPSGQCGQGKFSPATLGRVLIMAPKRKAVPERKTSRKKPTIPSIESFFARVPQQENNNNADDSRRGELQNKSSDTETTVTTQMTSAETDREKAPTTATTQMTSAETEKAPTTATTQMTSAETEKAPTTATTQMTSAEKEKAPTTATTQMTSAEKEKAPTTATTQMTSAETEKAPTTATTQMTSAETEKAPTTATTQMTSAETEKAPTTATTQMTSEDTETETPTSANCDCKGCTMKGPTAFQPKDPAVLGTFQNKGRKFLSSWYTDRGWVTLCTQRRKVFCATCRYATQRKLFALSTKVEPAFVFYNSSLKQRKRKQLYQLKHFNLCW
ncbi:proteoglycan 4-like [Branchiostoma floridae]|uniref:Proteoglycan 4-like n=1 Tax=Branchiostoma floridae TaxID=7739 RepID=A0A9J7MTY7_BRAFL|nr:proteoglycan 4-like [Branchiostoma floridae]